MISESHYVKHEKSNAVMVRGSYEKCRAWIVEQPDWEQYIIMSHEINRPIPFTISRGRHVKNTTST